MSVLFSPIRVGTVELANRFMHSATFEGMAERNGEVSQRHLRRYRALARGGIGLIIPGYMYVHPHGKAAPRQTGIHDDSMIPGLRRLADEIHTQDAKVAFQLVHAGRQTTRAVIGRNPLGPSSAKRDPVNFVKPTPMTEEDISTLVASFAEAAVRAAEAGADGVQFHAAHGYLLNQFLSPFYNRRQDSWGGSPEGRFRVLREIYAAVRARIPESMFVAVKLNTYDHTPEEGITPELAARYARWLVELGIDFVEISSGSLLYSFMNVCRGDVPVAELMRGLPWWKKPIGKRLLGKMAGGYGYDQPYHLEAAAVIKPEMGSTPLALVGGVRRVDQMERILDNGAADIISMSRPFIREPFLVRRIRDGETDTAACESCNKCLAAMTEDLPVRCYSRGLPA
jgi:2,4-dienoyl-CoA reductase-like NADH-dependent reductase (Old Yellow Enzyme family)